MNILARGPRAIRWERVAEDPVFAIELDGATPDPVWGRRGARLGRMSSNVTEVHRTWWMERGGPDDFLPDAVRELRAVGAQIAALSCDNPNVARFWGYKVLRRGLIASLELRGQGFDPLGLGRYVSPHVWVRLGIGPFPPTVDDPRRGPRQPRRVDGACSSVLIAALDARPDRWLGT